MRKRKYVSCICLLLVMVLGCNLTGCSSKVKAADLMEKINPNNVVTLPTDDEFVRWQTGLGVNLFRESYLMKETHNVLVSPLSIVLALSMTANGAAGITRDEMEAVLGGNISIDDLNRYLYTYVDSLPSHDDYKVKIANSIWLRDDRERLTVKETFLQANADYYGAQVYKEAFDNGTLKDINNWVDINTDGMIDSVLDRIDEESLMYIINALVFDAKWQDEYEKNQITDGQFTNLDGSISQVKMMNSTEGCYLENDSCTGFIKDYKDRKYGFVALLPNEDVDFEEYINALDGEMIQQLLAGRTNSAVIAELPKFKYDFDINLNDILIKLGMPSAFNNADFSNMGTSGDGNLCIGNVIHKTHITVDEVGTKAGAVTVVDVCGSSMIPEYKYVYLDRPFVYIIMDNTYNVPLFIGAVTSLE